MELKILSKENQEKGKHKMPKQFEETVRPDLIKRAVLVLQSNARQKYGADPEAGMKVSAKISRRRRDYKGSYGHGISRVPRKILSHKGTRFNWVGAEAPGTVGGRRAHPPKASKEWGRKINKKENRKAIRSALAATLNKTLVAERGHKAPNSYPFIADDEIEAIKKTKDAKNVLIALGFKDELLRSSQKSIRPGRGKMRGRKYKKKKGLLLVVSKKCDLEKSAGNIPGVDVILVNALNAGLLAPGTAAGRLTIFTKSAIAKMEKENLFM